MRPAIVKLAAVAITALVALACSGCHVTRPPKNHARAEVLYSAMMSDPRTFNPILVTDAGSSAMMDHLFEGLVRIDPLTTLPEPDLASSWEIGDGGHTITFHLRHGLKWSDGAPLTAHDVVFTMDVIYDRHVPNSIRPSLTIDGKPIKVEAPGQYTVRMILPRPFAPLLYAIGFPIIPAHVLESAFKAGRFNQSWGINTPPKKIIGNGGYEMTRYTPSQLAQFRRNPDYWMRDETGGPLPHLHGQTTLIVEDQNADYLRFLSGETDVYSPRPEEVTSLREKAKALGITVKRIGIDTGSLFF
ncbi:MAG: ABC transporter substrate-binding protein, partial [Candidatus Binataceae bacterium]